MATNKTAVLSNLFSFGVFCGHYLTVQIAQIIQDTRSLRSDNTHLFRRMWIPFHQHWRKGFKELHMHCVKCDELTKKRTR